MRSVLCDKKFEELLSTFGSTNKLSFGLIIGQIVENGKDFVIHLAKTPHSDTSNKSDDEEIVEILKVTDIDNKQVAEHALNALRMIVGGFNILGMFVVSEGNIFNDNSALQKLKTVFMDIKSTLDSNGLLFANTDKFDDGNKLLLNYVSSHKNFICKTISTDPSKAPLPSPVDWKFVTKVSEWIQFETLYEVDTVFPLPHTNNHFDTEKYIMETINKISDNLSVSTMFFNEQPHDENLTVEKLMKLSEGESKIKVTVYSDASKLASDEDGVLKPLESLVRYSGIIDSRVFGSPRNTIAEIQTFIRDDIIRSITTRMQIYYDALLANDDGGNDDESGNDQDVNSTVPPRRVFFPINNANIFFSDYLFQHEQEETTAKQAMDIFGIFLTSTEVDANGEAVVQLKFPEKQEILAAVEDEIVSLAKNDTGKLILMVGVIGLVVALLVSVALHFLMK